MDTAGDGVIIDALNEIRKSDNDCRTTTAMAKRFGISQSAMWMVLNGQRGVGVKLMKNLAQYSAKAALAVFLFLTDGDAQLIASIVEYLNNGDNTNDTETKLC